VGREWQLQQMRNGFHDSGCLLPQFLGIFSDESRALMMCGRDVTTQRLLDAVEFDQDYDADDTPDRFKNQPVMIRKVLARLTDHEARQFVRMSTGTQEEDNYYYDDDTTTHHYYYSYRCCYYYYAQNIFLEERGLRCCIHHHHDDVCCGLQGPMCCPLIARFRLLIRT